MYNWKKAAKYFWSQFILWRNAYNEVADRYMIANTERTGDSAKTFVFKV